MMPENYHYAFDDEYSGIPKELKTDVMLSFVVPSFKEKLSFTEKADEINKQL